MINSDYLNDVNIFQRRDGVFTEKVLDINDVLVLHGQEDPHLPQGSLRWKIIILITRSLVSPL